MPAFINYFERGVGDGVVGIEDIFNGDKGVLPAVNDKGGLLFASLQFARFRPYILGLYLFFPQLFLGTKPRWRPIALHGSPWLVWLLKVVY